MTASSILVFELCNPWAVAKELVTTVGQHITRYYEQCALMQFVKRGLIPTRDELMTMHRVVENWPDKIEDLYLKETLENGLYTRELHMPADSIVIGRIHKYPYFASVLSGKCLITSEFYTKIVEAPCSFTLPAGVKHVVFNLEDTVWSDVHNVKSKTTEEAEKEIFAESYEELDAFMNIVEGQ